MSYLGRPSAGDSPFAIGQKAFFDTTSPQAPAQRNPTPRASQQGGVMSTPQPYGGGNVSGEARRRYEERYAKKKEEEAAAAAAAAGGPGPGPGSMGPPPPNHHAQPPRQQQPPPPMNHQQSYGSSNPVPPGGYPTSPQPQHGFNQPHQPHPQNPNAPPQWSGFSSNSPQPPSQSFSQSPQPPHGNLQPQQHPSRSSFDQSRPQPPPQNQSYGAPSMSSQRSQSPYDQHGGSGMQSPSLGPGQGGPGSQRWSQSSGNPQPPQQGGGPQWSQKAAPPPPQDFRGRPGSAQGGQAQQGGGGLGPPSSQGHHSQGASVVSGSTGPPGPDQGDEELRMMFEQFDSSRSGQLNSYDLQRLLAKDSLMEDPREDAVKMLMNIFDTDRSGSINFMEFEGLYRYIQDWHGIFQRFDRDSSGLIDRKELHQALLGFGFSLPPEMVRKLEKRFAPPPKLLPGGQVVPRKGISFDRFLMACVTVKHYTEGFRRLDPNNTGKITVDYNSFMEMVLDAP